MFQTVKPRARYDRRVNLWMVHSAEITVFGDTLNSALRLWRGCWLESVGA